MNDTVPRNPGRLDVWDGLLTGLGVRRKGRLRERYVQNEGKVRLRSGTGNEESTSCTGLQKQE